MEESSTITWKTLIGKSVTLPEDKITKMVRVRHSLTVRSVDSHGIWTEYSGDGGIVYTFHTFEEMSGAKFTLKTDTTEH